MQEIKRCLCCGSEDLFRYLDLGLQPLANNLKEHIFEPDELYPLAVNRCNKCHHSQLTVSVDKGKLFSNYLYVSGTSKSLRAYFELLADKIVRETGFKKARILDIACNDGTFLECFDKYGWQLWGVDPARNLVQSAVDKGITVFCNFFPCEMGQKFDVITALNVVAHTDTPYEFLVGCKKILNKGGYIYIQTSQRDMVVNGEFDTVYHEHQSFFTERSMRTLTERAGLYLEKVEAMDVHGGSYLFTIRENDPRYEDLTYVNYQNKVDGIKGELTRITKSINMPLVGYGAAAKGIVLLNYLNLPVEYVIDDNPLKQDKVIGGVNIPIYNTQRLKEDKRGLAIIILAWNMYEEIADNIRRLRGNKDIFIKPFPKICVSQS